MVTHLEHQPLEYQSLEQSVGGVFIEVDDDDANEDMGDLGNGPTLTLEAARALAVGVASAAHGKSEEGEENDDPEDAGLNETRDEEIAVDPQDEVSEVSLCCVASMRLWREQKRSARCFNLTVSQSPGGPVSDGPSSLALVREMVLQQADEQHNDDEGPTHESSDDDGSSGDFVE